MQFELGENGKPNPRLLAVSGTPEHPANYGRLCVKGSRLVESNQLEGRLLQPKVAGVPVNWEMAIDKVATGFKECIAKYGKDSVAFYVSGQLLTEDYYVANKLMKGYIGSANIDTNSRLCMSSAVAGYKRAFGADAVPCSYDDLEQSQLVVLVGSNAAWTHPVLYQRIERAKQLNPGMKVVVVDPRATDSCAIADVHLQIRPGSDVALFNGLLRFVEKHNAIDEAFVTQHTEKFAECIKRASRWCEERVAEYCDVPLTDLRAFYRSFAFTQSSVTVYSMGVNQSTSGVDKSNAIINCHLATGKIGKPGSGPFSMTGQPNAMGGREVGGLANLLACHMDLANTTHRDIVQSYWQSPEIADKPGYLALDLFDAIDTGKVKAVWIMATNPVVSMPNRALIERALKNCELVVVSDCANSNDTLAHADVVLPATGWSEKNGTVTNSERRISRQRGLLSPAGESRHDWQIICDVAKAMGFSGFNFQHPHQIFNEYAGLSGYRNDNSRDFDISALAGMSMTQYDAMAPVQWPVNTAHPQGTKRLFSDGQFFTASKKAQFIAVDPQNPTQQTNETYPFLLNSGRIRDQWHTMTRTGKVAELSTHNDKPYLDIHPADAQALNLSPDDLVQISSSVSTQTCVLHVRINTKQRKGELFAPMHWNQEFGSHCHINNLFASVADPISGQPELKQGAVALQSYSKPYYLSLCVRQEINRDELTEHVDYWLKQKIIGGFHYFIGLDEAPDSWQGLLSTLVDKACSLIEVTTPNMGCWLATEQHQQLQLAGWMSKRPMTISLPWYQHLLSNEFDEQQALQHIVAREPSDEFKQGRLVCSCFSVREKSIQQAIVDGCDSVEKLGQALQCGTNCGSCKSELAGMISECQQATSVGGKI
ncbi:MAG: molybdopterin-dependent oxidoreductase [Aestuariibacter sp.]